MPRSKHFDGNQHQFGEVAVPVVAGRRPTIRAIDPETREEAVSNAQRRLEQFRQARRDRERAAENKLLRESLRRRIQPRIILVDDDQSTLELTEEFIRQWIKNAEILAYDDPALAWAEVSRMSPDILITGFYHGPLSGAGMLAALAARRATFPILIISGNAEEEQIRRSSGPTLNVSLLRKPWTEDQLYKELSKHIGSGKAQPML